MTQLGHAERLACLRLIRSDNVGPVTFRDLINHFGGAIKALDALPDLARRANRGRPIGICPADRAERELEAAAKIGARPLFTIEPGYPRALAHVDVPPPLLYVKGNEQLLNADIVAMVGSRNGSAAGMRMARLLAGRLGESGFTVASGLARGIDGAAHEASMSTGTIAVLAGGIDLVYPPENATLHQRIGEEGCLVSECPPGFQPRAQDFPRRNRIISGIALGVIVVEAARRSGSLITARTAAEQGRLVMAVPGHPLDPRAEGPNRLIKDGATMITSPEDALSELLPMVERRRLGFGTALAEASAVPPLPSFPPRPSPPSSTARHSADRTEATAGAQPPASATVASPDTSGRNAIDMVLAVLGAAPVTLDEVARAAGLSAQETRVALIELDLAGRIEQHGGQLVSLRPD